MTTSRILATSGGFVPTGRDNARAPGDLFLEALRLSGRDRPRVLFVMTASGDDKNYLALSYQATRGLSVDADHLVLFPYPNQTPEEAFGRADVVWVGGGSVANLLALWRVHGVDDAVRDAWGRGVVLGGVSAGSICWHVGGTTDSFGPELRPVTDGLGLLPYANGVHYDSEEQRRPLLHRLVADRTLPTAYATDDGVGLHYRGTELVEALTEIPGKGAYRVERGPDGAAVETRLEPRLLS